MHKKIDVMIVGAQKAGTTSLLRYLGEHPACIAHPQKEFSFYTDIEEYNEGLNKAFNKFYSNQHYSKNTKIIAKNAGLYTRPEGLLRLKENNPKCEIICILRNPVERTYSSYLMEKNAGAAKFDFSEIPDLIKSYNANQVIWDYQFFIDYGMYAHHLKTLYEYFPKEQVTVFLYDDLIQDALGVCQKIFKKIKVDDTFKPNVAIKHNSTQKTRSFTYARVIKRLLHNENKIKKTIKKIVPGRQVWKLGEMLREVNKTSGKHSPMDTNVKKYLVDYFKPFNKELEELIQRDLSHWNK